MVKKLDKLKIKIDKKLLIFLLVLLIVGIISGSLLVCIINNSDKLLVKEYLTNFVSNTNNGNIDYFFALKSNLTNTLIYVLGIWALGISIIGLPLILIMYFMKAFILGFSIGSIIYSFGFKGILFAIIYVFPGQIITLLALTILMIFAISFFIKLIEALFHKKTINFKLTMNKYLLVLLIVSVVCILATLYDTYLMPRLVKYIAGFLGK